MNGVDIVCVEGYLEGIVLFYMFCVDIDYVWEEVDIIYGKFGVKVWIYCGEVFLVCKNIKGGK